MRVVSNATFAGAVAVVVAANASAQSAMPVGGGDSQPALYEVVVTAQRREESLQDVPIAVSALSSEQLQAAGTISIQDLGTLIPSLQIGSLVGSVQPRLRGIGTSFVGPGIESSVASYVDGVYIAAMPASLFSFAGVDRVEILKGPQGTLFGRNATGGLIQVLTRRPEFAPSGSFELSYGNYQTYSGDAYVTGPLSDRFAANFAVHALTQDEGYGINQFTGEQTNRTVRDVAARSQVLFDSRDGTVVRFSGDYFTTAGSTAALRAGPPEGGTLAFGPGPSGNNVYDINADQPYETWFKGGGISLHLNQELSYGELVSISAWRKSESYVEFDIDGTPVEGIAISIPESDRQISQEIQLLSPQDSRIAWMLGAYYFNSKSSNDPTEVNLGPPVQNPGFPLAQTRQFATQKAEAYAAFGQVTVPIATSTNLTAGLRQTHERREFVGEMFGFFAQGIPLGVLSSQPKTAETYDRLTWRFAVDHQFSTAMMAYVSANRGFKSGGYNAQGSVNAPPFEPELLDAYELGVKADTLNEHLRINTAVFYYDYTNIQVPTFNNGVLNVQNGPSAKIYGMDLDLVAAVSKSLTLTGGVSLLHDRYGNFPGAVTEIPLPTGGNLETTVNAKGNRLPLTPDWVLTAGGQYKIPVSFGELVLNVTYNHNSGYYTETDNLRRQKSYDLVNASVRLNDANERLSFSLWAKNLTDEEVLLQWTSSATGTGAQYQPPRTYGATIGWRF